LEVASYESCYQEQVDEFLERRVVQYYAPSAAPTLAAGASNLVAGGALWLARNLFSPVAPPASPSPRQVATVTSYVLMGLGLPAVVVGIVGLAQSGERVEQGRVEEVVQARDLPCHPEPAQGTLTLVTGELPPPPPLKLVQGKATLEASVLRGHWLNGFLLDDQPIEVAPEAQTQLDALLACLLVLPPPSDSDLAAAGPEQREMWESAAQWCNTLPGAPAGPPDHYSPWEQPPPSPGR
jgi:hypothetical protein